MIEKHINFIELEKACAEQDCPLCVIISARAERFIDGMLFEHVSDRVFRREYRLAGGFCAFHSRKLETFHDGLAVAILGKDILEDRLSSFKKRKPWKPKEECPVCVERKRIEKEYLTFIVQADTNNKEVKFRASTELRSIFTASEGFCAPHYAKLLETVKHIPQWLIEFHENKFNKLMERTSRFVELSAYGRQEEFIALSKKDQLVWKELARNLRGDCE
ncbi:MAG: DUF6062 family protein [Treponema sp.]|nr:DUF6062 family protein [Treponema sp.]